MLIRRPLHLLAVFAALAALGLALAAGGCGGDNEPSASTDPEFTVPSTPTATTNTATTPAVTTPDTGTSTDDSGGSTTPDDSGNGGTTVPNGTSGGTPSGGTSTISPDEAAQNFEKYCREHPEACGE